MKNLDSNIHLGTPVQWRNSETNSVRGRAAMPFHNIPHVYLGRCQDFGQMDFHVFFPNLYKPDRQSNFLTDEQLALWIDKIIIHCIYRVGMIGAAHWQHIPDSFYHARGLAQAQAKERGVVNDQKVPRERAMHYTVPAGKFAEFWTAVDSLCLHNEAQGFARPILMMGAKNVKLHFMRNDPKLTIDTFFNS